MSDSEDLSARARRRELDDEEFRRLRRTLESSLEARLAHRAGLDFDAGDAVRPGDDELARRIVARVVASKTSSSKRRSRLVWMLAVAALCAGTAAAAVAPLTELVHSLIGGHASQRRPHDPVSSGPASPMTLASPGAPHDEHFVAPATPAEPAPARASAPERPSSSVGLNSASRGPAPPTTAATLFASANLSRREGHPGRAIDLYEELQRRYPDSTESRAADISLGMLLLDSGSAANALRHFERYLRAPSADLAPEALWGKSQALARLGRGEDARAIWQLIVDRYPDCAYAKAASAKLSLQ